VVRAPGPDVVGIELLLLSMSSVTDPTSAPPIRKKTSSMLTGSEAWLTVEPPFRR